MIETAVRLDEDLLSRLERLAHAQHTDRDTLVSAAVVAYLEQKESRRRFSDLDALAGKWSDEEAKEFEQAVTPFSQVDESIWR